MTLRHPAMPMLTPLDPNAPLGRKSSARGYLCAFFLAALLPAAAPAAPVNDKIDDRLTIPSTPPQTVVGDNVDSGVEGGEIDPLGGGTSVWWEWTPTSTGWVQFDTVGSDFDTILYAYTQIDPFETDPKVDELNLIASNDDNDGDTTKSRVNVLAFSGAKIHIAVHGFGGAEGNVTLNVSAVSPPPPGNDNFASATALGTVSSASVSGSNVNASIEGLEPDSLDIGGASVWWTWSPTVSGWYDIDTFGSTADTVLYVYTGSSLDTLVELEANDDDSGSTIASRVVLAASVGQTYRIAVNGYEDDNGSVNLNIGAVSPPPSNDDFVNSVNLGTTNSASVTGNNVSASIEGPEPDPDDIGGASAWWTWTSLSGGWTQIDTLGSDFDTVLYVFEEGATSDLEDLVFVASNDDASGGDLDSLLNLNATASKVYHIAVHGLDAAMGSINLNLAPIPAPPSNDNFANRTPLGTLPVGPGTTTVFGSNVSATFETDEPDSLNSGGASVWWSFTAPATQWYRIETTGSSVDTVLYVYNNGLLPTLNELKANDDKDSATAQSALNFQGFALQNYVVAVHGFEGDTGSITLKIRENNPHPPLDDFVNLLVIGSPATYSDTESNVDATVEGFEPDPLGIGGTSLWWKWVAPSTGRFEVNTLGSAIDTVLYVFDDTTIDALSLIAASDEFNGSTSASQLNFAATMGQAYHFAVHGFEGAEGATALNLHGVPDPPANDNFADLIDLGSAPAASGSVNTVSATFEPFEPDSLGNGGASVWWKWTPPSTGTVTIDTGGSDYDTVLYVYTGSDLDSLSEIASNNDALGAVQSRVSFTANVLTEYKIAVHGLNGAVGNAAVHVSKLAPYPSWLTRYPTLVGPDALSHADPDLDQFTNLEELVFGLDPTVNSRGGGGDPNAGNAPEFDPIRATSLRIFYTIDPFAMNAGTGSPITITGRWSILLGIYNSVAPVSLGGNDYKVEVPVDANIFKFLNTVIDDPN